jgi:hypothetical protein
VSLDKPASAAGLVIVSLAACLGASAAAAESNHHKPTIVMHRTHHAYRTYKRAGAEPNWSQMPPCGNKYITGVPCISSYDFGCWQWNDRDPVEHCGYGRRPIPLRQQWPIPLGQQ